MNFKSWYSISKCPNCGEDTIPFNEKMKLVDYRYVHTCNNCGRQIKLPLWHAVVYISEMVSLIALAYKFKLTKVQSLVVLVLAFLFIRLIQLPFIPIKGD